MATSCHEGEGMAAVSPLAKLGCLTIRAKTLEASGLDDLVTVAGASCPQISSKAEETYLCK